MCDRDVICFIYHVLAVAVIPVLRTRRGRAFSQYYRPPRPFVQSRISTLRRRGSDTDVTARDSNTLIVRSRRDVRRSDVRVTSRSSSQPDAEVVATWSGVMLLLPVHESNDPLPVCLTISPSVTKQ